MEYGIMNIIEVKHLRKIFYKNVRPAGVWSAVKHLFHTEKIAIPAVDDISFTIHEGEFVGFVGPNGAGKTTTLKMLSGILYPTEGKATVLGFMPWERRPEFQKKFSLVMGQKNQMWWDLPVIESFLFNKAVYEIPDDVYEKQKNTLVELLDIQKLLDAPVRKLSLGERMKCELATALLHKPAVLFLDEPTIGLDVISQKNIRDFLRQYNRAEKATIILTSHYMEDIRRLCDRVMIIDHGRLIYDGDYQKLVSQYADTKTIDITMSEVVVQKTLERFGILSEYRETSCKLTVPRDQIAEITSRLLKELPVDDISIHEESMEEIVSEIFENNRNV